MHVVISLSEHEIEMAHRWFDWVCELGGTEGHDLYIIPASNTNIQNLIPKANKVFGGSITYIKDEEGQISDWQNTDFLRSASGPNSAFRQVAWHFHNNNLGPYFWCELDCIPMRKDWLDRLESEYKGCGKPFMGADVQIESVPPHMSGNGIYVDPVMNATSLIRRTNWTPKGQEKSFELAFDIAGAREVLQKCHFTNLIQHKFRFKGFESRSEFDAVIDKNAVVFHSDKKGTIYNYLRQNLTGIRGIGVSFVDTENLSGVRDDGQPSNAECDAKKSGMGTDRRTNPSPAQELHGAGSVKDGGPVAEPVPLQTSSSGSASVVNMTFTQAFESATSESALKPQSGKYVRIVKRTSSDDLESVIEQNAVIKNGLPAMSPPWENREDSERDVKMLCDALSLFCKAPIYKSRVRNALREAKIIK